MTMHRTSRVVAAVTERVEREPPGRWVEWRRRGTYKSAQSLATRLRDQLSIDPTIEIRAKRGIVFVRRVS